MLNPASVRPAPSGNTDADFGYSANFNACLALTLKWEGGYCDNPKDPGGATKFGITEAVFEACHEARGLLRRAIGKPPLVKTLTRQEAAHIYHTQYWKPIAGDSLPLGLAMVVFDIAVNMGVDRAKQWLAATQGLAGNPAARIKALDARRRGFWHRLKTFVTFGKGWLARADDVLHTALEANPS